MGGGRGWFLGTAVFGMNLFGQMQVQEVSEWTVSRRASRMLLQEVFGETVLQHEGFSCKVSRLPNISNSRH